jgi:tRNA threonylcarbamoyladenosine biosynthesis protein TsaB
MKILGIETASGRCSVAITEGRDVLAAELFASQSMQAERLLSMIESVSMRANLGLNDVEYLAITNGPGSFTGIRIGLSTILGISMAKQITPVVVSNFSIINFRIREQFRGFDYACTIIDAYRGEYYFQIFDKKNAPLEEPALLTLEQIGEAIGKLSGNIVCSGACSKLVEILPKEVRVLPRFPHPDARTVCRLAHTQILKESFSSKIEPLYIRPPDAKPYKISN